MMTYIVFLLSVIFVVSFVGFSSKPSKPGDSQTCTPGDKNLFMKNKNLKKQKKQKKTKKPSPIYGGLVLIISGAVGCGIVLSFGGSFLGLMMFLIYLGGMLVVLGYTTAMATEQYPEVWVSNKAVLGPFIVGLLSELLTACYILKGDDIEVEVVLKFNGVGDWVIYDTGDSGFFSEETMGIAAKYSYGTWLVIVTGWSLFIGVLVIMEVTRGN